MSGNNYLNWKSGVPEKSGDEFLARVRRAGTVGYLVVHYACDLSGEEQPPFEGWFYWSGHGFREIEEKNILKWAEIPDGKQG